MRRRLLLATALLVLAGCGVAPSGSSFTEAREPSCRYQGRDLHAGFLQLLPTWPRPIAIQRWSIRRVGLMVGVVLLALLALLTALNSFASAGLL